MLMHALLAHAACDPQSRFPNELIEQVARASPTELQWALDAGLGPWLHWATADNDHRVPAELRSRLLGADLTARVQNSLRVEAALEVIDRCLALGAPVTLLKGISIGDEHYPAEHFRHMTDIDVLVPSDAFAGIERDLLSRGFRHGPNTLGLDTHHGVPLRHPKSGVWLELHFHLFPACAVTRRSLLFDLQRVVERSVPSTYHGRPVARLSSELQLAYVAAYLFRDLSSHSIDPSLVAPLVDAACLLAPGRRDLDWRLLTENLGDNHVAASIYLLVAFLNEALPGLIPTNVVASLRRQQSTIGPLEYELIRGLLWRYLLGGRRFTLFNSWHVFSNLLEPGNHAAKLAALPWRIAFPAQAIPTDLTSKCSSDGSSDC